MKLLIPLPSHSIIELAWEKDCFVIRICRRRLAERIVIFDIECPHKEITHMQLQLGVNKGTILNVPQSEDGTPRLVDGPIVCTAAPDGIVQLFPSPDGSSCEVVPVAAGIATFTATADADLSSGVVNISSNSISIEVLGAVTPLATKIVSTEGAVVPQ